jgi:hypothetical protein
MATKAANSINHMNNNNNREPYPYKKKLAKLSLYKPTKS